MAPRKSKNKSRKEKRTAGKFRSTLSKSELPEKTKFLYNPAGHIKMSEVLMEFIEPYEDMLNSEEDYRKIISTALVAWNAALLPEPERRAMVDQIIDEAFSFAADDARLIIDELIRRKERHFAEIKRGMLSYELTMTKDGPHVSVMSTLEGFSRPSRSGRTWFGRIVSFFEPENELQNPTDYGSKYLALFQKAMREGPGDRHRHAIGVIPGLLYLLTIRYYS